MILARNSITLHHLRDISTVVWYFKLQASTASAPAKPTAATPSGWTTTEPTYTEGSTNSLYVVQKTTFSDGTFEYSDVSLSSSYEAAKVAYNKSVAAKETADAAQESIDNLEIGGRNLLLKTAIAKTATDEYVSNYIQSNYSKELLSGNTDDYFTVSFDFVTTGDFTGYTSKPFFYVQVNGSATSPANSLYITEAQSGHYENTFKLTATQAASTSGSARIRLRFLPSGCGYTITNFKLEKGNRATDWTPAPEDMQSDIDALQPELIVGTHGTTATATWTGTSSVLTEIKAGTRIQYKLSSAGASNVTLNLTLKGGGTTGAKPVYFLNTTRLGTQYGVNATIDLIYDGSAWRVLNPYTNSNTVGTYGGVVKAGSNGVKNYSLVMRDTETTWVSLTTTAGTDTTKSRYTGKLYPDKVMYMGSNSAYASGATTGTCYEALAVNLQYSTNCGTSLVSGKAVYLVGTLDSEGLFTLDSTWWTQTLPTTENNKTYIYLGIAYSTTNIYLAPENTVYQFYEGKFRKLSEVEEMKAAKTATNYIAADNTGVMVADMTDGETYTPSTVPTGVKNTFIDEDSFNVRDGQTVLASFGSESQIGKSGGRHTAINSDGFFVYNGTVNISEIGYGDTNDNSVIRQAPYFTFGSRKTGVKRGYYSFAHGKEVIASNYYEAVFGKYNKPSLSIVVEKSVNSGAGEKSFNVDISTLLENCDASEIKVDTRSPKIHCSHSISGNTLTVTYNADPLEPAKSWTEIDEDGNIVIRASGVRHWIGIARFYIYVGSPNMAFTIGNGSSDSDRSNAFEIDNDGGVRFSLSTNIADDVELYDAIVNMGWEDDVIV